MGMMITPRMLAAAEEALGHEVEREWLAAALDHHKDNSVTALKAALEEESKDFERKGGRDVDQAEFIDGLTAVIAIRKLPGDPKAWSPRRKPKMGDAAKKRGKEWSPRGGHPPSYTRENPPPVDADLAVCEIPGEVRVSIAWIGEGLDGDFIPEDLHDVPVLRFTVDDLRFPPDEHGWKSRSYQDNSFATRMPAMLPLSVMESVCKAIARSVSGEESWKRRLEEWSWTDEKDARRIHAKGAADA